MSLHLVTAWCDAPQVADIYAAIEALPEATLQVCYEYWLDSDKPEDHMWSYCSFADGLDLDWQIAMRKRLQEAFASLGYREDLVRVTALGREIIVAADLTSGDYPQGCIEVDLIRLSGISLIADDVPASVYYDLAMERAMAKKGALDQLSHGS